MSIDYARDIRSERKQAENHTPRVGQLDLTKGVICREEPN
jgi:hypothetical protein